HWYVLESYGSVIDPDAAAPTRTGLPAPGPIAFGKWISFVMDVVFDSDGGPGTLSLAMDGVIMIDHQPLVPHGLLQSPTFSLEAYDTSASPMNVVRKL